MGEIKQTNFRIDQETADSFRKFCEENGMNQAQGFDHMMQVMELNQAKAMVPNSAKDIESFEMYVKKIMESYLKSVEDYNTARENVLEEFSSALASKDKTIASLQDKVVQLQDDKTAAEQTAASAATAAAQAIKESAAAKEQAETATKLADEKEKTIGTLAEKLAAAEEKAAGYDGLKKSEEEAKAKIISLGKDMETLTRESAKKLADAQKESDRVISELKKDHETEIRELKADMERQISDTQKDAALAQEKAVSDKEREMNALLREADKENAKLQVRLEALQARIDELTASRKAQA